MDLNHFKTPDVAPMLVKLYDTQRLYDLANDKEPAARMELSGMIAELLTMDLSARETELIADVLIALIHQAEINLRHALSDQLSRLPNVPLRLILELANDEIAVAKPILENSIVLGEMDLIYIIKSKPADYWRAIAKRDALDNSVIDALANTKDEKTACTLALNEKITLTDHAARILSDMALECDQLAEPLIKRNDIAKDILENVYALVGDAMKYDINKDYDICSHTLDQAMDSAILQAQIKQIKNSSEKNFNEHTLIALLKKRDTDTFIKGMSEFSGLSAHKCADIMMNSDVKLLAVICRAKSVQKAEFISLFLLGGIFRSEENTAAVPDTQKAIRIFDVIRPEKARIALAKMVD